VIDALMYAVRDTLRNTYGYAECEIMDDGRPPPRAGGTFISVHGAKVRSDRDNQLMEYYDFSVTLTVRITIAEDRVGDQLLHRNIARLIAEREGLWAKVEQLRRALHMSWPVLAAANENMRQWLDGVVYGFCEPARYTGCTSPKLVGGEWFTADPDAEDVGVTAELSFAGARRMQPQTLAVGPFA
jgi:hypothetical protein